MIKEFLKLTIIRALCACLMLGICGEIVFADTYRKPLTQQYKPRPQSQQVQQKQYIQIQKEREEASRRSFSENKGFMSNIEEMVGKKDGKTTSTTYDMGY